jgi:hypothetical protein
MLFAHLGVHYEKTFADHLISILVLKRGVGGSGVGKSGVFPHSLHHDLKKWITRRELIVDARYLILDT